MDPLPGFGQFDVNSDPKLRRRCPTLNPVSCRKMIQKQAADRIVSLNQEVNRKWIRKQEADQK